MSEYIDVTLPIKTGQMHYPADTPCTLKRVLSIADGDKVNLTDLNMSAHTGTHADAPAHFIQGGKTIDEMEISHFIGRAKVLDFSDKEYYIDATDLADKGIEKGDIILLKTHNSARLHEAEYLTDYVYLTAEAAEYLAEREILTVGIDFLTIDGPDTDFPAHYALLGAGIVIFEGLNLLDIEAGEYEMVALPIKIAGGDGAPARVLLKKNGCLTETASGI